MRHPVRALTARVRQMPARRFLVCLLCLLALPMLWLVGCAAHPRFTFYVEHEDAEANSPGRHRAGTNKAGASVTISP